MPACPDRREPRNRLVVAIENEIAIAIRRVVERHDAAWPELIRLRRKQHRALGPTGVVADGYAALQGSARGVGQPQLQTAGEIPPGIVYDCAAGVRVGAAEDLSLLRGPGIVASKQHAAAAGQNPAEVGATIVRGCVQ